MVARTQLVELGMTRKAIQHRVDSGRLHRLWWSVYAVGRPEVSERGRWMAAVLTCGPTALLSHRSAAALWGFRLRRSAAIDIVVPGHLSPRRRSGIRIHRRAGLGPANRRIVDRIPVTDPVSTLIDLASEVSLDQLEFAVNEADRLDLIDPEELSAAIEPLPRRPGLGRLRRLLGRDTFRRTDSGLERRFLPLARAAGLPPPETQVWLNGYRVDFYWPRLGLVVETDSLRYHRTAIQQAKDQRRDQVHTAAGLTALRFPEAQIRDEPGHVRAMLTAVAKRLEASHPPPADAR